MDDTNWDDLLSYLTPQSNESESETTDELSYLDSGSEQPEPAADDPTDEVIQSLGYGFEDSVGDEEDTDVLDLESIMGNQNSPYHQLWNEESTPTDVPPSASYTGGNYNLANYNMAGNVSDLIAKRETGSRKDPYSARALDSKGNEVSSASGKYQFLWGTHSSWIQKVTGVKSREEFLASPQAQEQAFAYWDKTTLTPEAMKFFPAISKAIPGATLDDVKLMIHFAGAGNVKKAVESGNFDRKLDAFGTSIRSYIKK